MRRGPVTFPDIAGCMAHNLPVRSLLTIQASHWKIMRHTACNIRKSQGLTVHYSGQWGASNVPEILAVP